MEAVLQEILNRGWNWGGLLWGWMVLVWNKVRDVLPQIQLHGNLDSHDAVFYCGLLVLACSADASMKTWHGTVITFMCGIICILSARGVRRQQIPAVLIFCAARVIDSHLHQSIRQYDTPRLVSRYARQFMQMQRQNDECMGLTPFTVYLRAINAIKAREKFEKCINPVLKDINGRLFRIFNPKIKDISVCEEQPCGWAVLIISKLPPGTWPPGSKPMSYDINPIVTNHYRSIMLVEAVCAMTLMVGSVLVILHVFMELRNRMCLKMDRITTAQQMLEWGMQQVGSFCWTFIVVWDTGYPSMYALLTIFSFATYFQKSFDFMATVYNTRSDDQQILFITLRLVIIFMFFTQHRAWKRSRLHLATWMFIGSLVGDMGSVLYTYLLVLAYHDLLPYLRGHLAMEDTYNYVKNRKIYNSSSQPPEIDIEAVWRAGELNCMELVYITCKVKHGFGPDKAIQCCTFIEKMESEWDKVTGHEEILKALQNNQDNAEVKYREIMKKYATMWPNVIEDNSWGEKMGPKFIQCFHCLVKSQGFKAKHPNEIDRWQGMLDVLINIGNCDWHDVLVVDKSAGMFKDVEDNQRNLIIQTIRERLEIELRTCADLEKDQEGYEKGMEYLTKINERQKNGLPNLIQGGGGGGIDPAPPGNGGGQIDPGPPGNGGGQPGHAPPGNGGGVGGGGQPGPAPPAGGGAPGQPNNNNNLAGNGGGAQPNNNIHNPAGNRAGAQHLPQQPQERILPRVATGWGSLFMSVREALSVNVAEEQRKAAEKLRIEEEKAAEKKRLQEEQADEKRRIRREQAAEKKRLQEEQAAEKRRLQEEQAAEKRRLQKQKAKEQKKRDKRKAEEDLVRDAKKAKQKKKEQAQQHQNNMEIRVHNYQARSLLMQEGHEHTVALLEERNNAYMDLRRRKRQAP